MLAVLGTKERKLKVQGFVIQSEFKASLGNLKSCLRIKSTVRGWDWGGWNSVRITDYSLAAQGPQEGRGESEQ